MEATYDIFGSLPDTIDDEWIQDETGLKEKMDFYIHERKNAEDAHSDMRQEFQSKANIKYLPAYERYACVFEIN